MLESLGPRDIDELLAFLETGTPKEKMEVANGFWGEAKRLSPDDVERIVPALENALEDEDPVVRAMALAALVALEAPGAIERARAATADPDWFIRAIATAQLGHHDRDGAPYVLPLLDDPEFFVRQQAVGAIGNLGYVDGIPALEDLLRREKDPDIKSEIEEMLARLRGQRPGGPT